MSTPEERVRVLAWALILSFAGSHGIVGEADLFVEPVHIELSDKGSIVVVFEQLRNQCLCELILIEDDERVAVVSPANEVSVFAVVEKANSWLVSLWPSDIIGGIHPHLLNFWTNGGICFRFSWAVFFSVCALCSKASMSSFQALSSGWPLPVAESTHCRPFESL